MLASIVAAAYISSCSVPIHTVGYTPQQVSSKETVTVPVTRMEDFSFTDENKQVVLDKLLKDQCKDSGQNSSLEYKNGRYECGYSYTVTHSRVKCYGRGADKDCDWVDEAEDHYRTLYVLFPEHIQQILDVKKNPESTSYMVTVFYDATIDPRVQEVVFSGNKSKTIVDVLNAFFVKK